MKRRASIYKLGLLVVVFLSMLACQGGRRVAEEKDERPAGPVSDGRGFDPLEFPGDREIIPQTHPRSGDITGRTALVEATTVGTDTTERTIENVPDQIDSLNNQAYRVQISAGKLYGEAKQEVVIAEEIFDRPVFLDYEVPYFKVRVGNFANREQAEEYQQRAKAAGYKNAWVVMVNIKVRETAPIYEEGLPVKSDSLYLEEEPLEEND